MESRAGETREESEAHRKGWKAGLENYERRVKSRDSAVRSWPRIGNQDPDWSKMDRRMGPTDQERARAGKRQRTGKEAGTHEKRRSTSIENCKRFACPADPSCACACSPEGSARSAPQEALEASRREPRRRQNPTPRGPKASPEGSGSLLGARSAPDGLQGCSETAFGRLLGRSWDALGVVLGALGSLPAPPGPLLGVILASRG